MKTYKNFNEMFNENSNTKKSMNVFNEIASQKFEGYYEWMIYPNKPVNVYGTNHGAIISVWCPLLDLTEEEKVTFGMQEPDNGVNVYLHIDSDNNKQLLDMLAEGVNAYFKRYYPFVDNITVNEIEQCVSLTLLPKQSKYMFNIAKELTSYLNGFTAADIVDAIQYSEE